MKSHKERVNIVRNYLATAIQVSDQQTFLFLLRETDEFHATDAFDELSYACDDPGADVEEVSDAVYNVLQESKDIIYDYFTNAMNFAPGVGKHTVTEVGNFDDDALKLAQEIIK